MSSLQLLASSSSKPTNLLCLPTSWSTRDGVFLEGRPALPTRDGHFIEALTGDGGKEDSDHEGINICYRDYQCNYSEKLGKGRCR